MEKTNSIGTLAGFSPFDFAALIKSGKIKVEESLSTTALLEKLMKKKVELIYISKFIGSCKLAKLHEGNNVIFSELLPHDSSHYSLSTIKYPKLITSFNDFLKAHKVEIEKMKQDYVANKCK